MKTVEPALIALVGVLLGVLLGEYFRRRKRIEVYSERVFERRLEVYEKLMTLVQGAYTVASEVMSSGGLTEAERHDLMSAAILPIAEYVDDNALYVDPYVGAHVTAAFMGAEDVQAISDTRDREAAIAEFQALYKSTKRIILEESGVYQINKHFRLVSRSKPDSSIIGRIRELERD